MPARHPDEWLHSKDFTERFDYFLSVCFARLIIVAPSSRV